MADLLLGQVLRFVGDPFVEGEGAAVHDPRGGVVVEGGRIVAVGGRTQCDDAEEADDRGPRAGKRG